MGWVYLPDDESEPEKYKHLTELSLFSGMGGGLLGARLSNIKAGCYVEWDKDCQETIQARIEDGLLEDAPIWDDATSFDGTKWRGSVDLITGGFPCQPFSTAGSRLGEDDPRNMWPATVRIIKEVGPKWCLLENVPGLLQTSYFGTILADLANAGYGCWWVSLSAATFKAPHKRKRIWLLAFRKRNNWRSVEMLAGLSQILEAALIDKKPFGILAADENWKLPVGSLNLINNIFHPPWPEHGLLFENRVHILPNAERPRALSTVCWTPTTGDHGLRKCCRLSGQIYEELYPTPMSSDKDATGKGGRLARSTGVFPSFPTPCADDSTRASETHTSPLNKAVFRSAGLWPTPTATDAKESETDANLLPQEESKNYCLYPPWVEWLMGWPEGWTSLSPMDEDAIRDWTNGMLDGTWFELTRFWEMPKMAKKEDWPDYKARLKALGNGQVSIVAHAIWEIATKGVSPMADRLTKQQRSTVMRAIKGKNTWMEKMVSLTLRKDKRAAPFKMNDGSLPGSPDIVFHSEKVAVFLDGCFWHGCPKCYRRPQSNQEFWDRKLENTKKRDVRNEDNLKAEGWSVIRLWEHEIKADCAKHVDIIVDAIKKRGATDETPETRTMRRTKFP